ncbi:MAG TPA: hypothetical protein VGI81_19725 [Tepidisphaeraceae bacterium]|jgi:predicted protein tyrosine phosphatase
MKHPQLAIFGYSEAAMFLRGTSPPPVGAIVSIHGRREFGVESDVPRRLDLAFDDVEIAVADDVMAMQRAMSRKRWAEQNGLIEVAPVAADAEAIVKFAEAVHGLDGIVLCHCAGGMSRAPAAALICLSVWRGPGMEAECVTEILRLRPGAVPHVGLLRFADELLGWENRLVGALAAVQRQ